MSLSKVGAGTLVLVPGIMGSELRLNGRDTRGVERSDEIWAGDIGVVWMSLCRQPERLTAHNVVAADVIREFVYTKYKKEPVYGPLIDFCCAKDGLDLSLGKNFCTFGYDWRLDLRITAQLLGKFISQLAGPIFIIAHSMGGLVTRLLLNMNLSGAEKVKGVFQIASPVSGSTKAYYTLKRKPDLGSVANAISHLYYSLDSSARTRLMFALRNMAALFQLLPPSDNKILLTAIGLQKSAVDSDAWLATDRANIQAAYEVHELLCGVPSIDLKCIYSIELKTDWLIKVSEYWDIISVQADALGDGTVVGASAMAASLFRTIVH